MSRTTCTGAAAILLLPFMTPPAAAQGAARPAGDRMELRFNLGTDAEYERNFDLDDDDREDEQDFELALRASLSYRASDRLRAFLEAEAGVNLAREQGERDETTESFEINQAYLAFSDLPLSDSGLIVGRFLLRDHREWLIDENLDGIRVTYAPDRALIDLSLSRVNLAHRDLLDSDSTGDAINNLVLLADVEVSDDLWIGGYGILRDDRSDARAEGSAEGRPVHFGLRSHGELARDLTHWLDVAAVRGNDGAAPLKGHAVTTGGTYTLSDRPAAPRLTLGYAWASGDDDAGDGRNRAFRQTGLQSNEGRFGDSSKFKYYGEAFDPELSNMAVLTAGIGANPSERLSLDLVYHRFWQVKPADGLRDAAFDPDPNADGPLSRDLGEELDLIIAYEPADDWEIQFAVGYFRPGAAYDDADPALFARLEVDFSF